MSQSSTAEKASDSSLAYYVDPVPQVVEIPIGGGSEQEEGVVTIDQVEDDPEDLIRLLENEQADAHYWIDISLLYVAQDKVDQAIEFLERGLEFFQNSDYGLPDPEKCLFHSVLAWIHIGKARAARAAQKNLQDTQDTQEPVESDPFRKACQEATINITAAMSLNSSHVPSQLGAGVLSTLTQNFDDASRAFEGVLGSSSQQNAAALLGKARLLYDRKNYRASLKLYQQVLSHRPDFRPDPRLGIGLCYYQLGLRDFARRAWDRAVELDPENPRAHTLLGLLMLEDAVKLTQPRKFQPAYTAALRHLQTAYKLDKTAPAPSVALSSYLYSINDLPTVERLCRAALAVSSSPGVAAEAHFWLARALYKQAKFVEAEQSFHAAQEVFPGHLLAQIGLAQCQIAQNSSDARLTLESIVHSHPQCREAVFLLGMVYAASGGVGVGSVGGVGGVGGLASGSAGTELRAKATAMLEKYTRLCGAAGGIVDPAALLTLATLYEHSDEKKALEYLTRAMESVTDLGLEAVPALLDNNVGVFHFARGNFDSARSFLARAVAKLPAKSEETADSKDPKDPKEQEIDKAHRISLTYNLGRVEEALGNKEAALKLYSEVSALHPQYVPAKIRQTYLETAGEFSEAGLRAVQQLLAEQGDDLEVRTLYAWFLARHKKPMLKQLGPEAQALESNHLKETLMVYDHHDFYSEVAMGNIYCSLGAEARDRKAQKEKALFRAAELYHSALKNDPQNAYAAQGVAVLLAELKRFNRAADILRKVRDTLQDSSVYLNLGHCFCELGQWAKATEAYEIVLNRFAGEDGKLLLAGTTLLGRAWLLRGQQEKSLESLYQALRYSRDALELSPESAALQFNVALVLFYVGDAVHKKPQADRTVEDIERALQGLQESEELFEKCCAAPKPPYPMKDLKQRIGVLETLKNQLVKAREAQEKFAETAKERLAEALRRREAEKAKLEAERLAKEKAEQERKAKIAEERRILDEQAREWALRMEEQLKDEEMHEEEKKARKPRRGGAISGSEISDGEDMEAGNGGKSRRSKKRGTRRGSATPKVPKRRKTNPKIKSNEVVSDSDSEEDAEPMDVDAKSDQSGSDEDLFGDADEEGKEEGNEEAGKQSGDETRDNEKDNENGDAEDEQEAQAEEAKPEETQPSEEKENGHTEETEEGEQ